MCEEWSWKACRRVEVNRVIAEGGWRRVGVRDCDTYTHVDESILFYGNHFVD